MLARPKKTQESSGQSLANAFSLKQSSSKDSAHSIDLSLVDNRPEAIAQRKRQTFIDNSPKLRQLKAYQTMANEYTHRQGSPIQRKVNHTGLPNQLKTGMEQLSGYALDDVKVHYNSSKPAQLRAHAYAQGTNIHLASGQEKHLPHEAWHVIQQKQGRVKPTIQAGGISINDNKSLEKEADTMGQKALQASSKQNTTQLKTKENPSQVIQLFITKDTAGLQEIIEGLRKAYAGNVDESVILQKALHLWEVNDQGHNLAEEVNFTLSHFATRDRRNEVALKSIGQLHSSIVEESVTNITDKFFGRLNRLKKKVNTIQASGDVYPLKVGAPTNVYGTPIVSGLPSSPITEDKAKILQEALIKAEVYKQKYNEDIGEREPSGYMMGVGQAADGQWLAAFSGTNEPRNATGEISFRTIAAEQGFSMAGSLSDLTNTLEAQLQEFETPTVSVAAARGKDYSTVQDSTTGEQAQAKIGACAGAKIAGCNPVSLTELYIHPQGSSVSIHDHAGVEQTYDPTASAVPSCLNCQFLIPLAQAGSASRSQEAKVETAVATAQRQVQLLDELKKRMGEIVNKIVSNVKSQKRVYGSIIQQLGFEQVSDIIRQAVQKEIATLSTEFQQNPDIIVRIPERGVPRFIQTALASAQAELNSAEAETKSEALRRRQASTSEVTALPTSPSPSAAALTSSATPAPAREQTSTRPAVAPAPNTAAQKLLLAMAVLSVLAYVYRQMQDQE